MRTIALAVLASSFLVALVDCAAGSRDDSGESGDAVGGTLGSGGAPGVGGRGAVSIGGGGAAGTGGGFVASGGGPGASGGGSIGTGGASGTGGSVTPSGFGTPSMQGSGSSSDRYASGDVIRDGVSYRFMANGWGPGFSSQSVSWLGTSFVVQSMNGSQGGNYEPASYPTVFCGAYSSGTSKACGLPATIASLTTLRTGWRWAANGNGGQYNAAYDIWIGNGNTTSTLSSYLMVWLRDPPGQQPAGSAKRKGVQVTNVPGTWDIWVGTAFSKTCVSYVRPEGQDSAELEFDVLDFLRNASVQGISLAGSTILSVAVGFEIWNGPVSNLATLDFYVKVN
jgi:hypothetical protein